MANIKIKFEIKEKVAMVGFGHNNKSSMTVLDEETLLELKEIVEEIKAGAKDLEGVIFYSEVSSCFLAGADIKMIETLRTESEAQAGAEKGQFLFNEIEDLPVPTVACVHGPCLGGGLELALACNSIVASDSSKTIFGLPEVKLGILPGFGGTYRLPRKIGLPKALDLVLSGRTLKGKKAKRAGIVEAVFPKERLNDMAPTYFIKA